MSSPAGKGSAVASVHTVTVPSSAAAVVITPAQRAASAESASSTSSATGCPPPLAAFRGGDPNASCGTQAFADLSDRSTSDGRLLGLGGSPPSSLGQQRAGLGAGASSTAAGPTTGDSSEAPAASNNVARTSDAPSAPPPAALQSPILEWSPRLRAFVASSVEELAKAEQQRGVDGRRRPPRVERCSGVYGAYAVGHAMFLIVIGSVAVAAPGVPQYGTLFRLTSLRLVELPLAVKKDKGGTSASASSAMAGAGKGGLASSTPTSGGGGSFAKGLHASSGAAAHQHLPPPPPVLGEAALQRYRRALERFCAVSSDYAGGVGLYTSYDANAVMRLGPPQSHHSTRCGDAADVGSPRPAGHALDPDGDSGVAATATADDEAAAYAYAEEEHRRSVLFRWNGWVCLAAFSGFAAFVPPIIRGFVGFDVVHPSALLSASGEEEKKKGADPSSPQQMVKIALICRLSVRRAGTRYNRRGIDSNCFGYVANFSETEQIAWTRSCATSFVSVRGSVPARWSQTPDLRVVPRLVLEGLDRGDEPSVSRPVEAHAGILACLYAAPTHAAADEDSAVPSSSPLLRYVFLDLLGSAAHERALSDRFRLAVRTHNREASKVGDTSLLVAYVGLDLNKRLRLIKAEARRRRRAQLAAASSPTLNTNTKSGSAEDAVDGDDGAFEQTSLVVLGALSEEHVADWGAVAVNCWPLLEPMVDGQRRCRGANACAPRSSTAKSSLPAADEAAALAAAEDRAFLNQQRAPTLGRAAARQGVLFRFNCLDCLDRSNIGQCVVNIRVLQNQLAALGCAFSVAYSPTAEGGSTEAVVSAAEAAEAAAHRVVTTVAHRMRQLWVAHGNELALLYTGTRAHGAEILAPPQDAHGPHSGEPSIRSGDAVATAGWRRPFALLSAFARRVVPPSLLAIDVRTAARRWAYNNFLDGPKQDVVSLITGDHAPDSARVEVPLFTASRGFSLTLNAAIVLSAFGLCAAAAVANTVALFADGMSLRAWLCVEAGWAAVLATLVALTVTQGGGVVAVRPVFQENVVC